MPAASQLDEGMMEDPVKAIMPEREWVDMIIQANEVGKLTHNEAKSIMATTRWEVAAG